MASASAVECTATVAMPISLQARRTLSAISPRLAINTLSNIAARGSPVRYSMIDQRLAELDRLAVADEDGGHHAGLRGRDVVHGLHGLDDQDGLALGHARADLDEGRGAGLGRQIGGADHGRLHAARMLAGIVAAGAGLAARRRCRAPARGAAASVTAAAT